MMRRSLQYCFGIIFAIFIAGFVYGAFAATVIDLFDQPSSTLISTDSNHKFTFTTTSTISYDSVLAITFPSEFDLSSIVEDDIDIADDGSDLSTAADCSGVEMGSVVISGQTVSIEICNGDGGEIANSSVVTVEIGTNAASSGLGTHRITNPSGVASYFINFTETGGNSGSLIFVTTTIGGSTITATVPEAVSSYTSDGGSLSQTRDQTVDPEPEPVVDPDPVVDEILPVDETPPEIVDALPVVVDDGGVETPASDFPANDSESSSPEIVPGPSSSLVDHEGSVPRVDVIDVLEEEGTEPILPDFNTDEPTDVAQSVLETPKPVSSVTPIKKTTSVFVSTYETVTQVIEDIRSSPEVQVVVDLAIPVTVVAAVSTTAVLATSFNLLSYLQFIFTSPLLFIARRKRKAFGIVYNSVTKVAIDLAIVRLYNIATNRLVKSSVTDTEGKYFFVVDPGQYRVTVTKTGFVFPSTYLSGVKDDGVFLDVYSGQNIEVTEHDATIAANIPLDVAQGQKLEEPVHIARRKLLRKVQYGVSFSGSVLSGLVFVVSPTLFTGMLVLIQVTVFALFWRLARAKKPRGWGVVYDSATKRPVGNAIVRLFEPKYNKLVETTLTDTLGRYSFLVGPNEYFVSTNREGYEEKVIRPIDYRDKQEPEPLTVDVPLDPKTRV